MSEEYWVEKVCHNRHLGKQIGPICRVCGEKVRDAVVKGNVKTDWLTHWRDCEPQEFVRWLEYDRTTTDN